MSFLTFLWLTPLVGGLIALVMPDRQAARRIAILASVLTFIESLIPLDYLNNLNIFTQNINWVKALNISYYLRLDGLSYSLVLLTTFLSVLSVWASWEIKKREQLYYFFLLLLEASLIGVFIAFDFVLFYLFWEAVLIPMYFIIGIWGGENRRYAANKFFLYTLAGSVFLLLAGLIGYFYSGTFSFETWKSFLPAFTFWLFFFGFAVKIPVFPFHTWLPDAHVEAPTPGSMMLAGVLLKMGVYGFMRFLLPSLGSTYHGKDTFLFCLGLAGLVYGGAMALTQNDIKKIVAYTSVSHMGVAVIGIASQKLWGAMGALFQMLAHGVVTALLFLMVGLIYHRFHTRDLSKLGGIASHLPLISGSLIIGSFASLGLPGLANFVGEFAVFLGAWKSFGWLLGFGVIGLLLDALVFLRLVERVLYGERMESELVLADLSLSEKIAVFPLILMTVILGILPAGVFNLAYQTIIALLEKGALR